MDSSKQGSFSKHIKLVVVFVILIAETAWLYSLIIPKLDKRHFSEAFNIMQKESSPEDYERAARIYKRLAAKGNHKAQNNLGSMYLAGDGVPQNTIRAIELFKASYQNSVGDWGSLPARNLGRVYYSSAYGHYDINKAVKWFEKSADKGDALSEAMIGYINYNGIGAIPEDKERGFLLMKKAANMGSPVANHFMGLMYMNRRDKLSYISAGYYYARAGTRGHKESQKWVVFYDNYCFGEDSNEKDYPEKCYFNQGVAKFRAK